MTCDVWVGPGLCMWCNRPVQAHPKASCPDCLGWGHVDDWEDDLEPCWTCRVSGTVPASMIDQEQAA